MKLKLLIVLTFILSEGLSGQENPSQRAHPIQYILSTRIGINTLNQLNIQYEHPNFKDILGLKLNLGFNYGPKHLGEGSLFCGSKDVETTALKKGIIVKLGVVFYSESAYQQGKSWSVLLDYRRSSVNDLAIMERCNYERFISERYDWSVHDLGLYTYRDFFKKKRQRLQKQIRLNMYMGLGVGLRFEKIEYSIDGIGPFGPKPSDRVENNIEEVFRFDWGVRFSFVKFKS